MTCRLSVDCESMEEKTHRSPPCELGNHANLGLDRRSSGQWPVLFLLDYCHCIFYKPSERDGKLLLCFINCRGFTPRPRPIVVNHVGDVNWVGHFRWLQQAEDGSAVFIVFSQQVDLLLGAPLKKARVLHQTYWQTGNVGKRGLLRTQDPCSFNPGVVTD